ncbi:MAG TPA: SDR family oxidoreductase [Steroidobacteraceae bacterium]|nr:SDR family oxidoreductase [Steroidobacteraceae bacterium]
MRGKICLVTGATSGIGEATAHGLVALGATVIVHGRDPQKGRRTIEALRQLATSRDGRADSAAPPSVTFAQGDLASLAEVRRLADELARTLPRLDVLVLNAGLACARRTLTADGYERTFAVNHLAPFLLTVLLCALLERSSAGRIVVVSSEAHRRAHLDFDDLMLARGYDQLRAYSRSKLANLLFTRALARRIEGTALTCNALHPGVVRTAIFREAPALLRGALATLGRLLLSSPTQGARTSLYLASSAEVAGQSGGYYIRCKPVRPSAAALDDAAAERLWAASAELTGCGAAS